MTLDVTFADGTHSTCHSTSVDRVELFIEQCAERSYLPGKMITGFTLTN